MANCIEPLCIAISQVTACCAFTLSSIDNRNFMNLCCLFVLFWFVFVAALDLVCLSCFFVFLCLFVCFLSVSFVCLFVCLFFRPRGRHRTQRAHRSAKEKHVFCFCLSVRVPDCLSASVSVCLSWLPILTEDSSFSPIISSMVREDHACSSCPSLVCYLAC